MRVEAQEKLTPSEYHARRDAEERAARERLRGETLAAARAAIRRLAPRYPAIQAVYLFGSVLQPGWFTDASDVDVAAEIDDLESEGPFVRALERELPCPVDLRPLAGALRHAVESEGERVYERKYLTLIHRILADLETLNRLWSHLAAAEPPSESTAEEALITLGYRLHNLYTAAENIFLNIAKTFGNQLENRAAWHAELLERMRLDLMPLRPAVIDDDAYDKLHELRRYRHLFRAAYGVELDPERMELVWRKALALRQIFPRQVEGFLAFLRRLEA